MSFEPIVVAGVVGLMVLANRLVEALFKPAFEKFGWDKFYLMYVAWVLSGVFVAFTELDLFAGLFPNPIVGRVITSIVAGGGANIIHDISDIKAPVVNIVGEETEEI